MSLNAYNIKAPIIVSTSYVQKERHTKLSNRFNVLVPESVGDVITSYGLTRVSISTGHARLPEYADFQGTISRYRGDIVAYDADGMPIYIEIIYKSKNLGRGQDCISVGLFRERCKNGMQTGTLFFDWKIRHSGNSYEGLREGIVAALACAAKLGALIAKMQSIQLTPAQLAELTQNVVGLVVPENAVNVRHRLGQVTRPEDNGTSVWLAWNRFEENAVKGGNAVYELVETDATTGISKVRHMTARPIKPNTDKDAKFQQKLFSLVEKYTAEKIAA
jgi:hypothetical protein